MKIVAADNALFNEIPTCPAMVDPFHADLVQKVVVFAIPLFMGLSLAKKIYDQGQHWSWTPEIATTSFYAFISVQNAMRHSILHEKGVERGLIFCEDSDTQSFGCSGVPELAMYSFEALRRRPAVPPVDNPPVSPMKLEDGQVPDGQGLSLESLMNSSVLRDISVIDRRKELNAALEQMCRTSSCEAGDMGLEVSSIREKAEIERDSHDQITMVIHSFKRDVAQRLEVIAAHYGDLETIPTAIRGSIQAGKDALRDFPALNELDINSGLSLDRLEGWLRRLQEEILSLQIALSPPDHNLLPPELDLAY